MKKTCFKCLIEKNIDDFYIHKETLDGHLGKCKDCCKQYQANRDTREIDKKRYRKNIKRMLTNRYRNMVSRTTNRYGQKRKSFGKPIISKEIFFEWCEGQMGIIKKLHTKWVKSGYDRNLAPSIDRIDSSKGYVLGNMQWITNKENNIKR